MENLDENILKGKVIKLLKMVFDPEIPVNVYDLGLIYDIEFEYKNRVVYCYIKMTLTSPSCPVAEGLLDQVKYTAQSLNEIFETYVELVFDPIWDKSMISEEGKEILELNGVVL